MSESTKPRGTNSGKPETAMQKLKDVWKRLPEATQDYWREQFSSSRKQADLRAELAKKLSIKLPTDSKLTQFRAWLDEQDQRMLMAGKIEDRKQELLSGGMTLEQAQDVLLSEASVWAAASKDFKLGLKVSGQISKAVVTRLDQEKFKESLRTKIQAGLDAILKEASNNPVIKEAVKKIQEATAKE
ncbi:MAG TPA: hypothetical protein VK742_20395 [Candidatus Sulfotelmatobacter sp.]|jgi:hypothetical protein|nr:hypothetical protein [Candidatus Sulfotelmatobacter sp.]